MRARPLCVVSDKLRFIHPLIAKNATSTLREELGRPRYASYERYYDTLDPDVRQRYFTFAVIREPVSRLLSAYTEISARFDQDPEPNPSRSFFLMEDTPERFATFLEELDDARWDSHLQPQVDYLDGLRVDRFVQYEALQAGVEGVFRDVELGRCPTLPRRRPREQLVDDGRYCFTTDDLDNHVYEQIATAYIEDVQLYSELFAV